MQQIYALSLYKIFCFYEGYTVYIHLYASSISIFCEYINYKCHPIDLLAINLHTLECLSKFLFHALSIFLPKTKILGRSGKNDFPLLIILYGGMGRIRTRLSSGYEPAADAILASIPY